MTDTMLVLALVAIVIQSFRLDYLIARVDELEDTVVALIEDVEGHTMKGHGQ